MRLCIASDDASHWNRIAKQSGARLPSGRDVKRKRIADQLDWDDWTQEEKEIYAAAWLFPAPAEPLIDRITINGVQLNMSRLSRTAVILDDEGQAWRVAEWHRPEKA